MNETRPKKSERTKSSSSRSNKRLPVQRVKMNTRRIGEKKKKAAKVTPKQVMAALQEEIVPVDISLTYRFALLLVAVVLVMLILVYVGIIGLLTFGVYSHAVHNTKMMATGFIGMILYLMPIIGGPFSIFFMLKPLFSKAAEASQRRSLLPENEPFLFHFVDRICDIVGSPQPERIDLDCQVNASASFRRGVLSFLNDDLVLTIGMPLVAGLSLRQFAGVLAHELGHFAQGGGMRLTYIIRSISHWFTRVVYERDGWDETLIDWSQNSMFLISWSLHIVRLIVWINRQVLWILMLVGHMVAGFMLRQMEFDADRYEARLSGSKTFETTARKLHLLMYAHNGAMSDLSDFYAEGRLADDLPRLILVNIDEIPEDFKKKVNKSIDESETGWFDTHPADSERIDSAYDEESVGIFQIKAPASVLFSKFSRESKRVTSDFYHLIFGRKMKKSELHPVKELLVRKEAEDACFSALNRYYQGTYSPLRPLIFTNLIFSNVALKAPANPKECLKQMKSSRETIVKKSAWYNDALKEYDELDTAEMEITMAKSLLRARFNIERDFFNQPLSNRQQIEKASKKLKKEQWTLSNQMEPFEATATLRLEYALQLFKVSKVNAKVENAEEWDIECTRLFNALHEINSHTSELTEIRNERASLILLLNNFEGNEDDVELVTTIRQRMKKILKGTREIRRELFTLPYPFDHVKVDISVGKFALAELPDKDNPGEIIDALDSLAEKLLKLNARLIGRLCILAEEVELLLGMDRLPEVKKQEESDTEDDDDDIDLFYDEDE